ncbi:MAG: hypothetical protein K0V04_15025 [Deltaproteobacteria bacterium]|nr:hypothetical protein [Deltaproteobacteria bacterium]
MSTLETFVGNMSVATLAEIVGLDVDVVVERIFGKAGALTPALSSAPARQAAKSSSAGQMELPVARGTRTHAKRAEFDTAIFDFLREQTEPVRARAIKAALGGTSAQVRTRLHALIEAGQVRQSGQAAGTRYALR